MYWTWTYNWWQKWHHNLVNILTLKGSLNPFLKNPAYTPAIFWSWGCLIMGALTEYAFSYQQFIANCSCLPSTYRMNSPMSKTNESVSIWLPSYPPWTKILCLGRIVEACQLRGEGNVPVIVGQENSITAVMCHHIHSIIFIFSLNWGAGNISTIPHGKKCAYFC